MFIIASIFLLIVWLALMLFSKETRFEQLLMSIIGLVLTPGAIIYSMVDYLGQTEIAITISTQLFIFAFSFFGIAAVAYQIFLSKHPKPIKKETKKKPSWMVAFFLLASIWVLLATFVSLAFKLEPIQGFIVGGLLIGMYIVADRKDLLANALLSGLFMAILLFIIELVFFAELFGQVLESSPSAELKFVGVPVVELVWAAVVGFAIGPLYEYLRNLKLK